jgi:hypothetical protein
MIEGEPHQRKHPVPSSPDAHTTLARLERGATLDETLAYFDTLAPAALSDMVGAWRGTGIPTGGPFDGLLENVGWHGKRFDSVDDGHPLVFADGRQRLVSINPGRMPISLAARHGQHFLGPVTRIAFRMLRPVLVTRRPRARLRSVEYRGVVTAAMSYDQLPIIDVFRSVDADTLMGAMDMRGLKQPYLFVLRRLTNKPSATR